MDADRWQRIKNIYQQALDLDKGERRAFVVSICGDDADLAAEVMKLLEVPTQGSSDIDGIVESAAESFSGALPEGERIGPYRLLEVIGTGGMGHVYLAERADREFEQRVAIKTVNLGSASPSMIERFRLERQILADLDHNNIARLLDGGQTDSGMPYLVMEFIDGESIVDYCAEAGLPLDRRLDLFLKICDAVQYAHRQLIVHRDIKPSNILVTRDGVPKLLDFGVAKLLDASRDEALTRVEARILTPEYASPEQVLGEPVTTSTDVYGLGVLLYQLLSGSKPFDLGSATSPEIRELVCHTDPVEPSRAAANAGDREQAARLSGDLDRIIMKAIRKEPERRYETVREVANDILNHQSGRPVAARGPSWTYRTGKFFRRHRTAVVTTASVVVAMIAMTVYYTIQLTHERDTALLEKQTADAATEFMIDLFASNEPNNSLGEKLTARQILERGAEKLEEELEETPRVRARLMQTLGRVYERLGDYDSAQRFLEEGVALRRSLNEADREGLIVGIENLAWLYYHREDWTSASASAREALAMREAEYGPEDPSLASVLNHLGTISYWLDDTDACLDYYHRALSLLGGDADDLIHDRIVTMNNLAITYDHLGEYDKAETFYSDSLATRIEHYGPDHAIVGIAQTNMGTFYRNAKKWNKAIEHLNAGLRISRKTKGDTHEEVAFALHMLARTYNGTENYEKAEEHARKSAEAWAATVGRDHTRYAGAKGVLAAALSNQGRHEEALPHVDESLQITLAANGPDHTATADQMSNKARLLLKLGRTIEARPLAEEASRIRKKKLGRGHVSYWNSEQILARIEIRDGDVDAAASRLVALLADIESSEYPDAQHIASTRKLLAEASGAVPQP